MDALIIRGPAKLKGRVKISGSKNSALPLLFASLLFDEEVKYENVPRLWDIETTLKILATMGVESTWDKELGTVSIFPKVKYKVAPYDLVKQMRASVLALGPLVAKYGEARVSLPGGCAIGARPIDFHLEALRRMNVSVTVEEGYVKAQRLGKLNGAVIEFPQVSVTGTENVLMLAVLAEGETVIKMAAREPEVIALGEFLQDCGARIEGLGTDEIHVWGGPLKAPTRPVRVPSDRIETGTWIAIALATKSELELENPAGEEIDSVLSVYRELGTKFVREGNILKVTPPEKLEPVTVSTSPYPGFPTDMQAQLIANLCHAVGVSRVEETIFENRFMHVAELKRMGAQISIEGNSAMIMGPTPLQGAPIMATDLRASASLVVAALGANGQTKISRIYHLDRGYQRLDEKLRSLGAEIERIKEN